jgi:hypothetical protein
MTVAVVPRVLTPEKQKEVQAFIQGGDSGTKAAENVGIHPSTIANEALTRCLPKVAWTVTDEPIFKSS